MNKISVIVPFYNSESTIRRCVESVLDQTYVNFELIAVNDGSTDNSVNIMKKLALMDSRIILVNTEHSGVSHARNAGIDFASGDFIQFIDADDYIEPNMLQKMFNALCDSDADICVCGYTHPCLQNYAGDRIYDFGTSDEILKFYKEAFAVVVPWNKLYRRKAVTDNFVKSISFCEDEIFCISNMFNARRIVCISDKLYHYYVAPPTSDVKSCISQMAAVEFWNSPDSIWYKRNKLRPISQKIFSDNLPADKTDEFVYARCFDFVLWGLAIYCSAGASAEGICTETKRIMKEPDFIKSIKLKEKYGVKYIDHAGEDFEREVEKFVSLCYEFCQKYGDGGVKYKPFYVYLSIFAKLFFETSDEIELDSEDFTAQVMLDIISNSTPEAQYANKVCTKKVKAIGNLQTA